MTAHVPEALAAHLLLARGEGGPVLSTDWAITDRAMAYAVQDETLRALGPHGGWKVGAPSLSAEPSCAPLPAKGVLPSGRVLDGPAWRMRGIELEVAVRLGAGADSLDSGGPDALAHGIDAVLPALEVVEFRLADPRQADPLEQLADLQGHGALVLGNALPWPAGGVDLRQLEARLTIAGRVVAQTRGAHPVGDLLPLLAWLARHARERGMPLREGDIVTTGSCTGVHFASQGDPIEGDLGGLGTVALRF